MYSEFLGGNDRQSVDHVLRLGYVLFQAIEDGTIARENMAENACKIAIACKEATILGGEVVQVALGIERQIELFSDSLERADGVE